ncbi:hypothetical protein BpHYR1_018964 [Brachionus plicatilis]|uniref:Uncharacterized protein n=1 Tax=Brachionus plicatilis TaxID=10195 RepID=A0A3M7QNQ7_BRAPC|nr:hypothetical protein BpHYR1_018964 [Brachionus plicatilis]
MQLTQCLCIQFQVKLTSQLVREKDLSVKKRVERIREAQLEYNENRFSERLTDETNKRVKVRQGNSRGVYWQSSYGV